MFLTISGLLASHGFDSGKYELSKSGVIRYYKNRIIKILIPTWIFISIAFFIDDKSRLTPINVLQLLTCFYNGSGINIDGVGASWYIFIVMWLYILTPLVLRLLNRLDKRCNGNLYLRLIVFLFFYGIAYRSGCELLGLSKYNWRYANILACGDCFFIGVFSSQMVKYKKLEIRKYAHCILVIISILLALMIIACTFKNYSIYLKGFHALIAPSLYAIFTSAIVFLTPKAQTKNGLLSRLCNSIVPYTFTFYLWHTLILMHLCRRLTPGNSFNAFLIIFFIGLVITAYISYLTTTMNKALIRKML